MMKLKRINAAVLAGLAGYALTIPIVSSAIAEEAEENVEKIAVVGARGAPRSVTSSPVPVDVLSAEDITGAASSDMNNIIMTLVPSYTVSRQPISDGGTFIRPASLRGLPTDKTLVLVNGKRRHRAALVSIGGSGTQASDLATIPASAIGSVEVLRDGAAAQYGSDAIAGVINFQLKNNSEGGSFSAEMGQYYEGDGTSITLTANKGFALGEDGFLSISAEYVDTDATSRGEQYCEDAFCVDPTLDGYNPDAAYAQYVTPEFVDAAKQMGRTAQGGDVVQPWGQPNYDAARIFVNAGYTLANGIELYAFGNYSESEGDGAFNYRYPYNSVLQPVRLEDGTTWDPNEELFPGGFTPRFGGKITDYSIVGGLKGMLGDLSYDLSGRYGYDEISYNLSSTFNPSLMNESPTKFNPGDLINEETQFQADFTYDFQEYVFAFGLSYMDESYEITEGDYDSHVAGPYALPDPWGFCGDAPPDTLDVALANGLDCDDPDDPVYNALSVGSNGFPGYSPEFSETYSRDSFAVYTDISGDITDKLFGQAAIRYEKYSDFDAETVYKVAGFYQLTEEVGVRASYGTGFRAPTPGQQGTTNVSTRFPFADPVNVGLFPANGDIAQALGAEKLKPETSTNYTLGITANYGDFTLTVDYYNIAIEDRFYAISTLYADSTAAEGSEELANYNSLYEAIGVQADSIGGANYFQNAFDSVTEGVDVVTTYRIGSEYGDTTLTASFNYNSTKYDSDPDEYFTREAQYDFENSDPRTRGVFSVKHAYQDFQVTGRVSYFGEYTNANDLGDEDMLYQNFGAEFMFDLEGAYYLTENLTLMAGVKNLFDNYPEQDTTGDARNGAIYLSSSVVDWQGGYYYAKINMTF
jgi:iron complex outermembrane receptor protein